MKPMPSVIDVELKEMKGYDECYVIVIGRVLAVNLSQIPLAR